MANITQVKSNVQKANLIAGGWHISDGGDMTPPEIDNAESMEVVRAAFVRWNRQAKRKEWLYDLSDMLICVAIGGIAVVALWLFNSMVRP